MLLARRRRHANRVAMGAFRSNFPSCLRDRFKDINRLQHVLIIERAADNNPRNDNSTVVLIISRRRAIRARGDLNVELSKGQGFRSGEVAN